ncbi:MAG: hypothetical protein ACFFD6_10065, partial [Candidatus Thorarchaeota archaeon]
IFGRIAFKEFAELIDIRLMIRAHQVFPDGVQTFFEKKLYSVFSTSYAGRVKPKILQIKEAHNPQPVQI